MKNKVTTILTPRAFDLLTANATERGKGKLISRLIEIAADLPDAAGCELCELIAELDELMSKREIPKSIRPVRLR